MTTEMKVVSTFPIKHVVFKLFSSKYYYKQHLVYYACLLVNDGLNSTVNIYIRNQ